MKDLIPGGLAKGKTLTDIASDHGVSLEFLKTQWARGLKVELEHTTDRAIAGEIARDHLEEDPRYYIKLAKMEKNESLVQENDPVKAEIMVRDVPLAIEWVKGETREYPGSPHRNLMGYHYGFVRDTDSPDGDDLDVCVAEPISQIDEVYILTQLNARTGDFDEHKYMIGFPSADAARDAYIETMEPAMFGGIHALPWKKFQDEVVSFHQTESLRRYVLGRASEIFA